MRRWSATGASLTMPSRRRPRSWCKERQTNVANVARDVFVQRFHLRHVVGLPLHQLLGLRLDGIVRLAPVALQRRIPRSQFLPTLKGGQLDLSLIHISELT